MAKSKEFREIDLAKIVVSDKITDEGRADRNLVGLVKSVREHGVLEPIIVMPIPGGATAKMRVVAGRRRLAAAKKVGLASIPAVVMDLSEEEAQAIEIVENLQREDVAPLDQARHIQVLKEQGWTLEMIASKIGRSAKWAARRSSLTELSARWWEAVASGKGEVAKWPPILLEMVARLPKEAQDEFLRSNWMVRQVPSVEQLRESFVRYTSMLSTAPWKLSEADLVKGKPACDQCPKRSGAQPMLFDEADGGGKTGKKDRCLDLTCWDAKAAAMVDIRVAELTERFGKIVTVVDYDGNPKYKSAIKQWDLDRSKKTAKDALPCIYVSGEKAGSWFWGIPRKRNAAGTVVKPPKKASPKVRLETRRRAHVVRSLVSIVEAKMKKAAGIKDGDLLMLAAGFACNAYFGEAGSLGALGRWTPAKLKSNLAVESLRRLRAVLNVRRGDADQKGLVALARVLGVKLDALVKAAEKAVPVPKSWGKNAKAKKAK